MSIAPTTAVRRLLGAATLTLLTATLVVATTGGQPAGAAGAPVGFGTATSFAVLAGSTVTDAGGSAISGDLGVSPGTAVEGLAPGAVTNGTVHVDDDVAAQAQADATVAYDDAASRVDRTAAPADLVGLTLTPGTYAGTTLSLSGTLTLDAEGVPGAVFIFQSAETLITATDSTVELINGANPCNVVWQVGSSATLGTDSTMVGTVVALTAISLDPRASVQGRLLARNAAVTLIDNDITRPTCDTLPPGSPTTTTEPTTT